MRKIACLFIIILTTNLSIAQDEKPFKKWQFADLQLRMGGYEDHFKDLSIEGYQSMTRGVDLQGFMLDEYDDIYVSSISGGNIGAAVTFNPFSHKKEGYRNGQSLRFGLSVNSGRESMIQYSNYDYNTGQNTFQDVTFCLVENEVLADVGYLFSTNKNKVFSVYGGVGTNVGFTYNNQMLIFGSSPLLINEGDQSYSASSSTYLRITAQMGLNVRLFRGFSFYMESQNGGGWQFVHSGDTDTLESCSFFVGFNFDSRFQRKSMRD